MMNEVGVINEGEARRITERICILLDTTASQLDRLASLVNEAYRKRVDKALGYTSWGEYAEHEFATHTVNLTAPIRRELVGRLSEAGMSTRAIAPAINVSKSTVADDIQLSRNRTVENQAIPSATADPSVVGIDGKVRSYPKPEPVEHVDTDTGEVVDESGAVASVQPVTVRRSPRRPLAEQFTHTIVQLMKDTDALSRLVDDDRFQSNKQNIALRNKSDVIRAIEALSKVLEALK
ncbi:hypothetical protein [Bifidobacterium scaligerum]|uniref:Uncharacterized protein n=1 Tax=Bifidobacterium scaligerum TaxID=2052656 RepID=A0A2M9HT57_9BIFI|nr:hypothetical protein [Bifidobacterium scaligerum]PJM79978.1 hypothetical protein CUU80_02255 [Bifidobacterium scaligerum]